MTVAITDLDGTLADLVIDWDRLRRALGVSSVNQLWTTGTPWDTVTEAECWAALTAPLRPSTVELLQSTRAIAVLTANSSSAADVVMDRTRLAPVVIVGRESLGGPKTDRAVFEAGVRECLRALAPARDEPVWYLGDQDYELTFARQLGLEPIRISRVTE